MAIPRRRKETLTEEDYELMMYWVGIYNEEVMRVIKVVNYMREHPIPKPEIPPIQLELPFDAR